MHVFAEMVPFVVVPTCVRGDSCPRSRRIEVVFIIDGAVRPLHLPIPRRRAFRNKAVRDTAMVEVPGEAAAELTAIVRLETENREGKGASCCPEGMHGSGSRFVEAIHGILDIREGIGEPELVAPDTVPTRDVFHVCLHVFSGEACLERFPKRLVPWLLPLGFPDELASLEEPVEHRRGHGDPVTLLQEETHLGWAVVVPLLRLVHDYLESRRELQVRMVFPWPIPVVAGAEVLKTPFVIGLVQSTGSERASTSQHPSHLVAQRYPERCHDQGIGR